MELHIAYITLENKLQFPGGVGKVKGGVSAAAPQVSETMSLTKLTHKEVTLTS